MRLGKLARELNIKPQEIAKFLRKEMQKDFEIDPNYKVEEKYIKMLKEAFPVIEEEVEVEKEVIDVVEEKDVEVVANKEEQSEEVVVAATEEIVVEEVKKEPKKKKAAKKTKKVEPEVGDKIDLDKVDPSLKKKSKSTTIERKVITLEEREEYEIDATADIIRAPKVNLDGLKVLGKIDLPEPKVNEEEEASEEVADRAEKVEEVKPNSNKPKFAVKEEVSHRQSEWEKRKAESVERQRARAKKEEKDRKAKKENDAKERKRLHYMETVDKSGETKKPKNKKKKKSKTVEKIDRFETLLGTDKPQLKKEKSFFGKIWHWFNH